MLKELICKVAGHHPWVHSEPDIRENNDCMDVYIIQMYGSCKRCGAWVPEDRKEILVYRFHQTEMEEPMRLTQKIDKFYED